MKCAAEGRFVSSQGSSSSSSNHRWIPAVPRGALLRPQPTSALPVWKSVLTAVCVCCALLSPGKWCVCVCECVSVCVLKQNSSEEWLGVAALNHHSQTERRKESSRGRGRGSKPLKKCTWGALLFNRTLFIPVIRTVASQHSDCHVYRGNRDAGPLTQPDTLCTLRATVPLMHRVANVKKISQGERAPTEQS